MSIYNDPEVIASDDRILHLEIGRCPEIDSSTSGEAVNHNAFDVQRSARIENDAAAAAALVVDCQPPQDDGIRRARVDVYPVTGEGRYPRVHARRRDDRHRLGYGKSGVARRVQDDHLASGDGL